MRPRIKEVLVVEGRYDKNTLLQVVDALVVTTDGFGVFRDGEKRALLRRLASERGIILLTDSDGAGFLIRNHLKGVLPPVGVKQAYIPDVRGKEHRKRLPGKEGKLGVEGMSPKVLLDALRRAGATFEDGDGAGNPPPERRRLTKADLMRHGLSGRPDSAARRAKLLARLSLPEHMTANALLEVLSALYAEEEWEAVLADMQSTDI
ncbi:MAG: DUF4093 domain-containing protein [Oscillospiraceae bacterium]|jgi:ribonuclease M5|nr:DUF4093 domain-containing protein [Oscillospiraceae bacterium]